MSANSAVSLESLVAARDTACDIIRWTIPLFLLSQTNAGPDLLVGSVKRLGDALERGFGKIPLVSDFLMQLVLRPVRWGTSVQPTAHQIAWSYAHGQMLGIYFVLYPPNGQGVVPEQSRICPAEDRF